MTFLKNFRNFDFSPNISIYYDPPIYDFGKIFFQDAANCPIFCFKFMQFWPILIVFFRVKGKCRTKYKVHVAEDFSVRIGLKSASHNGA